MNKKDNLIMVIIFLSFLLVMGVGSLIAGDREFSQNENRILQQAPTASMDQILSGRFEEAFQRYEDDQILWRDHWITVKTLTKLASGSRDLNGVYIGKDGYLIEKISEEDVDESRLKQNLKAVREFLHKLPASIGKSVILVPSAGEILKEQLPYHATVFDEDAVNKQAKKALKGCGYVDLHDIFRKNADRKLYYKTDHHWTSYGAFLAFDQWRMARGHRGISEREYIVRELTSDFRGALYSKVLWNHGVKDTIEKYVPRQAEKFTVKADGSSIGGIYQTEYLSQKDKYAVFLGGNYGTAEITGGAQGGGNLLIIKDSFANSFVPFAAEKYEKAFMIDLRYFTGNVREYIEKNQIGEVLVLYSISNMMSDRNISKLNRTAAIL